MAGPCPPVRHRHGDPLPFRLARSDADDHLTGRSTRKLCFTGGSRPCLRRAGSTSGCCWLSCSGCCSARSARRWSAAAWASMQALREGLIMRDFLLALTFGSIALIRRGGALARDAVSIGFGGRCRRRHLSASSAAPEYRLHDRQRSRRTFFARSDDRRRRRVPDRPVVAGLAPVRSPGAEGRWPRTHGALREALFRQACCAARDEMPISSPGG